MRATLSLWLALLVATALSPGCSPAADSVKDQDDDDGDGLPDGPADCLEGVDPFATDVLAARLGYLASDELGGRKPGTAGDVAARAFIEERFRCIGLVPPGGADRYQLPFTTSLGDETANVVGYLRGSELGSEVIVVGAHHDHLGVLDGEIHNGANDNASGVVALLAIAEAIERRDVPPRRTIAFVTFGFEENDGPCEGSEYYVDHAPADLSIDRMVHMVNADMVGTYPTGGLTAYGSFAGTPAREILDELLPDYPNLDVSLGESADHDSSDFQAFCDGGIPYLYLETWDPTCYHQPCDDAAAIDYPSLAVIAALLAEVVGVLGDTDVDLAAAAAAAQNGCGA